MKPKVIHSEADYELALQRIDALMDGDPDPTSPEGQELELFSHLVEHYEKEKYPMDFPTPVEAIRFRMEQQGLTPRDLEPFIGPSGRVSEVLNRKRRLSPRMVKSLHDGLKIPYESLLAEVP
jgi:HTH-type transcriptional regulator/antitoxin HigA